MAGRALSRHRQGRNASRPAAGRPSGAAVLNGLVITADDFGAAPEVNEAVEVAHVQGVLSAASLMVSGSAAADAVVRARRLPRLRVGLHLVAADGPPTLPPERLPHITDADGRLRGDLAALGLDLALRPAARAELRAEIEAQFHAFRATGLVLDHVNVHRHYHLHPIVAEAVLSAGALHGMRGLRVPLEPRRLLRRLEPGPLPPVSAAERLCAGLLLTRSQQADVVTPRQVFGRTWSGRMDADRLAALIEHLPAGLSEIYLHPATADRHPAAAPGYQHRGEFEALTDPGVRAALERSGRRLCGYLDA